MAAFQPFILILHCRSPSDCACYTRADSYGGGAEFGKVGNELLNNSHLIIFFFLLVRTVGFLFCPTGCTPVVVSSSFTTVFFRLWDAFADLLSQQFFSEELICLSFGKVADDQMGNN